MAQIVVLDVDDELASIKGKLRNVKPGPAAIVVPIENRTMRGPMAMRVLRRLAVDFALDLAVISESPSVRDLANQQGLRAFGSTRAYLHSLGRGPSFMARFGRGFRILGRGTATTAAIALVVVVSVLVVAVLYLLLPQTTVTLVPVTERIAERIEITADPDAKGISFEKRVVPCRTIFVKSQGTEQAKTTGKSALSSAKAEGEVTLTKRAPTDVEVPLGTIVRTSSGERFTTLDDVILTTKEITGRVGIQAMEPGTKGNVSRGDISKVEGTLESQVSVFNEQATVGGGGGEVEVATQEDRQRLRASLYPKLEDEAKRKIEAERLKNEMVPRDGLKIVVLREAYDRDAGTPAKALNLEMELRASATFVNITDVEAIVRSWTPKLQPGYYLRTDSIKASEPRVVDLPNGATSITVDLEGLVSARINTDKVVDAVRWRTSEESKKYLSSALALAKDPQVAILPEWASRALRVEVIVTNPYSVTGSAK